MLQFPLAVPLGALDGAALFGGELLLAGVPVVVPLLGGPLESLLPPVLLGIESSSSLEPPTALETNDAGSKSLWRFDCLDTCGALGCSYAPERRCLKYPGFGIESRRALLADPADGFSTGLEYR